jgi:hypothetical protein
MLSKKKTNKKIRNRILLFALMLSNTVIIFVAISGSNTINIYSQENENQQQQESSFVLTAKLVDNEYMWIDTNNGNITNPTLNITSGIDNEITIKSLEGDPEEHELIIESISSDTDDTTSNGKGEELIASDEIEDGSSTTINFNPLANQDDSSIYQSLEYYCEYHPDTMRGKIQIK